MKEGQKQHLYKEGGRTVMNVNSLRSSKDSSTNENLVSVLTLSFTLDNFNI
jgi:hypothetical protein